jgi:hypothetical protein
MEADVALATAQQCAGLWERQGLDPAVGWDCEPAGRVLSFLQEDDTTVAARDAVIAAPSIPLRVALPGGRQVEVHARLVLPPPGGSEALWVKLSVSHLDRWLRVQGIGQLVLQAFGYVGLRVEEWLGEVSDAERAVGISGNTGIVMLAVQPPPNDPTLEGLPRYVNLGKDMGFLTLTVIPRGQRGQRLAQHQQQQQQGRRPAARSPPRETPPPGGRSGEPAPAGPARADAGPRGKRGGGDGGRKGGHAGSRAAAGGGTAASGASPRRRASPQRRPDTAMADADGQVPPPALPPPLHPPGLPPPGFGDGAGDASGVRAMDCDGPQAIPPPSSQEQPQRRASSPLPPPPAQRLRREPPLPPHHRPASPAPPLPPPPSTQQQLEQERDLQHPDAQLPPPPPLPQEQRPASPPPPLPPPAGQARPGLPPPPLAARQQRRPASPIPPPLPPPPPGGSAGLPPPPDAPQDDGLVRYALEFLMDEWTTEAGQRLVPNQAHAIVNSVYAQHSARWRSSTCDRRWVLERVGEAAAELRCRPAVWLEPAHVTKRRRRQESRRQTRQRSRELQRDILSPACSASGADTDSSGVTDGARSRSGSPAATARRRSGRERKPPCRYWQGSQS